MTSTTSTIVSSSVNSTSSTGGRTAVVRSSRIEMLIAGGNVAGQARQLLLDLIDGVDDVGPRLLVDDQQDAGLVVLVGQHGAVGRTGTAGRRCGPGTGGHCDRRARHRRTVPGR